MTKQDSTIFKSLSRQGISRRSFLKFCAVTASMLALPASERFIFPKALAESSRPSVIWLHFQECTGCTEAITRSFDPTLENLILNMISLEYHETLMAAAGEYADHNLEHAKEAGGYILIVEGSLSERDGWCTIGNKNSTSNCHTTQLEEKPRLTYSIKRSVEINLVNFPVPRPGKDITSSQSLTIGILSLGNDTLAINKITQARGDQQIINLLQDLRN